MKLKITATPKEIADLAEIIQGKDQKQNSHINVGYVPPDHAIEKLLKEMFTNPTWEK